MVHKKGSIERDTKKNFEKEKRTLSKKKKKKKTTRSRSRGEQWVHPHSVGVLSSIPISLPLLLLLFFVVVWTTNETKRK